jgi:hypothetical protein
MHDSYDTLNISCAVCHLQNSLLFMLFYGNIFASDGNLQAVRIKW